MEKNGIIYTQKDIVSLKKTLESHCGMRFERSREDNLIKKVTKRVQHFGLTNLSEYLYILFEKGDDEFYKLVNILTINETYFFRHKPQFELLKKIVKQMVKHKKKKSLFIWSAGCSIGAEPYTIAICLKDIINAAKIKLNITATDIDKDALNKAKEGVYSLRAVTAEMPESYKEKYFHNKDNEHFELDEEIKKLVTFRKHNLKKDIYPHSVDIIFCRNVLIYFNEKNKSKIIKNFHYALNNGGHLFLSPVEYIPYYFKSFFSEEFGKEGLKSFRKWDTDRRSYSLESEKKYSKYRKPLESYPYPEVVRKNDKISISGIVKEKERTSLVTSELLYCLGQLQAEKIKKYILDLNHLRFISNPAVAEILKIIKRAIKDNVRLDTIYVKNEYMKAIWDRAIGNEFSDIKVSVFSEINRDELKSKSNEEENKPKSSVKTRNVHLERNIKKDKISVNNNKQIKKTGVETSREKKKSEYEKRSLLKNKKKHIKITDINNESDISKYQNIFSETLNHAADKEVSILIDMQDTNYAEKEFFIILKRFIASFDNSQKVNILCPPHIELWLKKYRIPDNVIRRGESRVGEWEVQRG